MYNTEASQALMEVITRYKSEKDSEVIESLLEKGADPNACKNYGAGTYPVLAQAIVRQNTKAVELLINAGADIDSCLTVHSEKITMQALALKCSLTSRKNKATQIMKLLDKAAMKNKLDNQESHTMKAQKVLGQLKDYYIQQVGSWAKK